MHLGFPFPYGHTDSCPSQKQSWLPSGTSSIQGMLLGVPVHYTAVSVGRPQKGKKKKKSPLLYFTTSPFLSKIQQVSWGRWKAQSFHIADLLTGNVGSKTPLATCVSSNLASLTDCTWKPGYFHKRHNPKSKHLKLLEGNTEQNKDTQQTKRQRVISVEYFAEELSEAQENKVLCLPS